ncbi:hypothetical protein Ancab_028250 [Ancistrocladus abbreviatus]
MNDDGSWNLDLLQDLFDEESASKIRSIPICSCGDDRLIWTFDSKGAFSNKEDECHLFLKYSKNSICFNKAQYSFDALRLQITNYLEMWKEYVHKLMSERQSVGATAIGKLHAMAQQFKVISFDAATFKDGSIQAIVIRDGGFTFTKAIVNFSPEIDTCMVEAMVCLGAITEAVQQG